MHALHLAPFMVLLTAAPAMAELRVGYVDSSPDWFTIRNGSVCDLGPFELTIDLGTSPTGLIFDVSGAGAGVAGYSPLDFAEGGEQILSVTAVAGGDSRLILELDFLAGSGTIRVAIDVDDTSPASEFGPTIISPAEITGATAHVSRGGAKPLTASFGPNGVAILPLEACIA